MLLVFKTLIKITIVLLILYPQPIDYILDLGYLLPVSLFCLGGNFCIPTLVTLITLTFYVNRSHLSLIVISPIEILLIMTFNISSYISYHSNTLSSFFRQNELLFQDGFYIDFLQKQTLEM